MSQVPSVDARVDARSPAPLHGRTSVWACMSSTPWCVARLSRQKEDCNVVRTGDRMIQNYEMGPNIGLKLEYESAATFFAFNE